MRAPLRRACGGSARLCLSALVELVLSTLYAPIMMLIHSKQVVEILLGRTPAGSRSAATGVGIGWRDAFRLHRVHMAVGLITAVGAWFLSPAILAWLTPSLAGLILSAPLSRASGSSRIGAALARLGILATPEEHSPAESLRIADHGIPDRLVCGDGVRMLATDSGTREAHFRWAGMPPRRRGAPHAAYLTAAEKIAEAETLDEALVWLDAGERLHVAAQPGLVERLSRLPAAPRPRNEPPAEQTGADYARPSRRRRWSPSRRAS